MAILDLLSSILLSTRDRPELNQLPQRLGEEIDIFNP